jgi:hypothetical protein
VQHRKDGQCFHCDQFFTNGHKLVCKHLFTIEVLDDHGDQAPQVDGDDRTISIHALIRVWPRSGKTMQFHININNTRRLALLDFGSTHNFVDNDTADRASIKLGHRSGLKVAIANGDRVHSPVCCWNMSIIIGNEGFIINCYGLALGSYEMVLVMLWLESLGPMFWTSPSACSRLFATVTRSVGWPRTPWPACPFY